MQEGTQLEEVINSLSINITVFSFVFVVVVVAIAGLMKEETEKQKWWMFGSITAISMLATIALIGLTIYLNLSSFTKGPVHWHAGFEFFACGDRVDLVDPTGLSSKVGTPTLHEHNDFWVHLEGVPVEPVDASFGKFLNVVDVELSEDTLSVPTSDGRKTFTNGDSCNGREGSVQAFLYRTDKENNTFTQTKFASINEAREHVIRDEAQVPPGDCFVVYFGEETPRIEDFARDENGNLLRDEDNNLIGRFICEQYFHSANRGDVVPAGDEN